MESEIDHHRRQRGITTRRRSSHSSLNNPNHLPSTGRRDMGYGRRNFIAYQRAGSPSVNGSRSLTNYRNKTLAIFVATVLYTAFLYRSGGARSYLGGGSGEESEKMLASSSRRLSVATWNIAAINNNPFEYWITIKENPAYEQLMVDVEQFLENPGDKDVPVSEVFTPTMFTELDKRLEEVGWKSMKSYWDDNFSKRKIVSEFMKDPLLGSKRLASMPDRVTNTIHVDGGTVFRPTVINMYEGDLGTLDKWWKEWEKFMFEIPLRVKTKTGVEEKKVYTMLQTIKRTKYKDVTEEEERDSLPLQTMCGAIFDAILVHMMNTVSEPEVWQPLKKTMVDSLNKQKTPHTLDILEKTYVDSDIITLQEVSSAFVGEARGKAKLNSNFHIVAPAEINLERDQNSVIFLNKKTFPKGSLKELTSRVVDSFPKDQATPVDKGDILAITTENSHGVPFIVASFHGDTNGLATKPTLDALMKAVTSDSSLSGHRLIFGLDANTYESATPGKQQDVMDWGRHYVGKGLTSCWGDTPDPSNYTTYNARTYLQPQLNKACKRDEKRQKGDVNPKDFILFFKKHFGVLETRKDNTGKKEYIEDMAFPTLQFPSDHGILSTVLEAKE